MGCKLTTTIRSAVLRGLKTAWIAEGPEDGPILFFLHGYPDTAYAWSHQISYFQSNFRVIAPFARGAQPSEGAKELNRYSFDAGTLDHLSILKIEDPQGQRPVILVGHDLGGAQAWHLAGLLGPRLKAMVIINSLALSQMIKRFRSQPSQWLRSWYILPFLVPPLADPLLRRFPRKLLQVAHSRGGLPAEHRPRLGNALPGVVNPVRHYRAFLKSSVEAATVPPIKLRAPVLVLWGQEEPFLNRLQQSELSSLADNAIIRVLRGGHWLHREHSDAVNRLIEEFIC